MQSAVPPEIWSGVSCLHSRVHQCLKEKHTNEEIKVETISRIRVYPLKNWYTFPQSIAVTHESPEIVSWNASSVHMVELTIPLETGAENAGAMKQIRNAELVDSGTQDSYKATHNRWGWFKRVHSCHQFLTNGHNSECQTQIKYTPGEGGQSPSFRRITLH